MPALLLCQRWCHLMSAANSWWTRPNSENLTSRCIWTPVKMWPYTKDKAPTLHENTHKRKHILTFCWLRLGWVSAMRTEWKAGSRSPCHQPRCRVGIQKSDFHFLIRQWLMCHAAEVILQTTPSHLCFSLDCWISAFPCICVAPKHDDLECSTRAFPS